MGREPRAVRWWEKLIFYSARMTRTMTRSAQRQSTTAKEMQLLFPSTISADFQILDSLNSNSSHLPSTGRTKINCVSIWTCKRRNSKSANVFTKCVDFAARALFSSLDVSTCSKLSQGGKITRYTFLASPPSCLSGPAVSAVSGGAWLGFGWAVVFVWPRCVGRCGGRLVWLWLGRRVCLAPLHRPFQGALGLALVQARFGRVPRRGRA